MFKKSLEKIEKADLEVLIKNRAEENISLDYKRGLPGSTDSEVKDFLFDIASLANSRGGYLIFGIEEEKDSQGKNTGIPKEILGCDIPNTDELIRRIESLIHTGIEDRISGIQFNIIPVKNKRSCLIIHIPKSPRSPHMVTFRGSNKFYSRHYKQKLPMSISEIRDSVTTAANIVTKSEDILSQRFEQFLKDRKEKNLLYMAALPLYNEENLINPTDEETKQAIRAFDVVNGIWYGSRWSTGVRTTLWGAIRRDSRGLELTVFRNGLIGSVRPFIEEEKGQKIIYSKGVAWTYRNFIEHTKNFFDKLGGHFPVLATAVIVNVQGYKIVPPLDSTHIEEWKEQYIKLPIIEIENSSVDATSLIKKPMDLLYNAFGLDRCSLFNDQGNLKPHNL